MNINQYKLIKILIANDFSLKMQQPENIDAKPFGQSAKGGISGSVLFGGKCMPATKAKKKKMRRI